MVINNNRDLELAWYNTRRDEDKTIHNRVSLFPPLATALASFLSKRQGLLSLMGLFWRDSAWVGFSHMKGMCNHSDNCP